MAARGGQRAQSKPQDKPEHEHHRDFYHRTTSDQLSVLSESPRTSLFRLTPLNNQSFPILFRSRNSARYLSPRGVSTIGLFPSTNRYLSLLMISFSSGFLPCYNHKSSHTLGVYLVSTVTTTGTGGSACHCSIMNAALRHDINTRYVTR